MITTIIIGITSIVSVLAFINREIYYKLLFNAWQIKSQRQYWRFLTYGFVHANWGHLIINMFVLFSFGKNVEHIFDAAFGPTKGDFYFLSLYLLGLLTSTLWDFIKHQDDYHYNAVGASGAVSSVLFSSILMAPMSKLLVFPIPIPLPAFVFGVLYLIYTVVMSRKGKDNVGHDAHFWGAIFGILFTFLLMSKEIISLYQSLF
jgi:Uncharacterized membrane protein (homolog of Drosophila rhomboid)